MNTKFVAQQWPEILRFTLIALWGVMAYLLLMPSASAKEYKIHDLVVIKPTDLPPAARIAGEDMYLYEGNAKTYLYIEQDEGKHLLVLNVTDPGKITVAAETQLTVDAPYDFVGPMGSNSVLIRFRTKNSQESEWATLRLNKPASPKLVAWKQSSGEIVDPLDGHIVNAGPPGLPSLEIPDPYKIVDVEKGEAVTLATIPGVKKILTDTEQGRRFYLASDGLWVLRNLPAEEQYREEQAAQQQS